MYHKVKKKIHVLLHPTQGETKWDKVLNAFLIILILLNLVAVMLGTEASIYEKYKAFFDGFNYFSVAVFTIEYVLRLWSCTNEEKYHHWFWGRIKYIFSWDALIDLAAILPFYLTSFIILDLRELRLLRLLRLLKIFRLTSYMKATKVITNVFKNRFKELTIALTMVCGLIIIAACLMFFVEHPVQPKKFASIPDTLYWAVITLTTTGYGDMVPITSMGKLLTGVFSLMGVALFALPAGIITSGFLEEIRKSRKSQQIICPNCGEVIEGEPHDNH